MTQRESWNSVILTVRDEPILRFFHADNESTRTSSLVATASTEHWKLGDNSITGEKIRLTCPSLSTGLRWRLRRCKLDRELQEQPPLLYGIHNATRLLPWTWDFIATRESYLRLFNEFITVSRSFSKRGYVRYSGNGLGWSWQSFISGEVLQVQRGQKHWWKRFSGCFKESTRYTKMQVLPLSDYLLFGIHQNRGRHVTTPIFIQDISFVLEDYMEVNFNTILEDGSTDELGDLLVSSLRILIV